MHTQTHILMDSYIYPSEQNVYMNIKGEHKNGAHTPTNNVMGSTQAKREESKKVRRKKRTNPWLCVRTDEWWCGVRVFVRIHSENIYTHWQLVSCMCAREITYFHLDAIYIRTCRYMIYWVVDAIHKWVMLAKTDSNKRIHAQTHTHISLYTCTWRVQYQNSQRIKPKPIVRGKEREKRKRRTE